MKFCTVINCMDGRVQLPVINYLLKRFNVDYVDSITEPGPILILAEQKNKTLIDSILARVNVSIEKHSSVGIAVVGHYDCAGNPVSKDVQLQQLQKAVQFLREKYDVPIISLWVDENWQVEEISNHF
ncbi:MAG: hypothetical protein Q9M37_10825 [Desulfonauticus sp.]|nr:hypothetical protein [Desulfonauticus sp.]